MQLNEQEKKELQIKQQIFHNLLEVTDLYPQYSTAQHLSAILRRKNNPQKPDFSFWSSEELLNAVEKHKNELAGEDMMNIKDED